MTILIIDNYDSFTFNLYQAFQAVTEQEVVVRRNDKITLNEISAAKFSGIVLSPGPGHPSEDRDFGVCKEVIKNAAQLACPIMGVCLGHQGIAHHLGAQVTRAAQIVHGKTSMVDQVAPSPIFDGVERSFEAMRYHSFVVAEEQLPDCLQITARESRNKLIMALQHKELPLFGLQFHPESIGTPAGQTMVRNFVGLC